MIELNFKSSKKIPLTIARDYVKDWGVLDAVRELLQNALDSDSPFEVEFKNDQVHIRSRNSNLSRETLALGSGTKADEVNKIGKFGEGYKLALLVLTRSDCSVLILNGDEVWVPSLEHNDTFGCDLLHIEIRKRKEQAAHNGLEFIISGVSESDQSVIKQRCLPLRDSVEVVSTNMRGRILQEDTPNLYVNGLWVCALGGYSYSYDVNPSYIELERDRKTVSDWDLSYVTTHMWYDADEADVVAEMIDSAASDVSYAKYSSPQIVKDACWRLFQKQYPEGVPAENKKELEKLVADGFTKVVVVNSGMYNSISKSDAFKASTPRFQLAPYGILKEFFEENRSCMRRKAIVNFKNLLKLAQSEQWKR